LSRAETQISMQGADKSDTLTGSLGDDTFVLAKLTKVFTGYSAEQHSVLRSSMTKLKWFEYEKHKRIYHQPI
jgi:hypothetical protein